ncbi:MAG: amidohydrolase family protein, partial [Bacteroidetes bacterium]|nr:amidohydrolase family protein [Bacteroidota bacterium]
KKGRMTIEKMVEKMCHAPADCFNLSNRGYIREGYAADLVLIDPKKTYTVSKRNILYKCGWSPLEGTTFSNEIAYTFVNGNVVYTNGKIIEGTIGQRLKFNQ